MQKHIKMYPLPTFDSTYDASSNITRKIFHEARAKANAHDVALSDALKWCSELPTMGLCLFLLPNMQVCSLLLDQLTASGRLIGTRPCSILCTTRVRLMWQKLDVVASIIPSGRIVHSRFKISLTINDDALCNFKKKRVALPSYFELHLSLFGIMLRSMTKRQAVEKLDNSLYDIMDHQSYRLWIWLWCSIRWRFQIFSPHCSKDVEGSDSWFFVVAWGQSVTCGLRVQWNPQFVETI